MQAPLSILIFILLLITSVASHSGKEVTDKRWSTLLKEGSPVVKGVGMWKIRLMSGIKKPYDTWNKSTERKLLASEKQILSNTLTVHKYLTDNPTNSITTHTPKYTDAETFENYANTDANYIEEDKPVNDEYAESSTAENKEEHDFEAYKNWIGKNKEFKTQFSQPFWQLPVSKFNESQERKENLTIYPLSILHRVWQKSDRVKRIDEFNENDIGFENDTVFELSHGTDFDCKNECIIRRSGSEIQKGDLDVEDTFQERMGGGGQPILLIKDKGDAGGSDMTHPASGKDSLGPLIMMMTPLIMMCIMIPMMMSVMGGLMSFMKSMTTMMMVLTWPSNASQPHQALITKQRKIDEINQNRTNEFLSSFILELSERLEEALNKYDI